METWKLDLTPGELDAVLYALRKVRGVVTILVVSLTSGAAPGVRGRRQWERQPDLYPPESPFFLYQRSFFFKNASTLLRSSAALTSEAR